MKQKGSESTDSLKNVAEGLTDYKAHNRTQQESNAQNSKSQSCICLTH